MIQFFFSFESSLLLLVSIVDYSPRPSLSTTITVMIVGCDLRTADIYFTVRVLDRIQVIDIKGVKRFKTAFRWCFPYFSFYSLIH